jgi:protein TonB
VPLEKVEQKPKPKEPEKPKETKKKPEKPKKKEDQEGRRSGGGGAEACAQRGARRAGPDGCSAGEGRCAGGSGQDGSPRPRRPRRPISRCKVTDPNYAGHCPRSYPKRAIRRNLEGTVVIQAQLGTDGKATSVIVKQSSGHDILDENAREMILECEFTPRKVGGVPVRVVVEIPIPYVLK